MFQENGWNKTLNRGIAERRTAMIKDGKFGTREAVFLAINLMATKDFYTSIRALIKLTGTAAWYSTILSCLGSLVLFSIVYLLMKRFPGKELTDIFDVVTGKVIGKILSLVFVAYLIFYTGSNLREFLEMIKAYALPYTAPSLIMFGFMVVVAFLAFLGLETIARMSIIFFYVILTGFLLVIVLAYPYYNVHAVLPIGGYGIPKTVNVGLFRVSAYDEIVFLAFVINSFHGVKVYKKVGVISLLFTGFVISLSILCDLMAFEYTQGSENLSGLYQLARIIYFNRFFQRIESIFLFIWVMASFICVATAFYISLSVFCKAFKVEGHRPLILPFSFLVFMVALLPKSLSEVSDVNIAFVRQYSMFIVYLVPILVFLIALIFGKKGEKKKNAEG
jgi:spore germination protein KB